MLDIKFIRNNPEIVKIAAKDKKVNVDIDKVLTLDERRRHVLRELEDKRAEQNKKSNLRAGGKPSPDEIVELKKLKDEIKILEEEIGRVEVDLEKLMLIVPNIPSDDTPIGPNETGNKVLRQWGKPRIFSAEGEDFQPKEHFELGEELDLIDTERASQITGARFGYLKRDLVLLEFALIQFALNVLTDERTLKKISRSINSDINPKPFIPVVPPVFIKPEVFQKMARLEPKEERYYIQSDDLYLIGSAEHTLGPLHMDQVINEKDLPIRYVGFSTSFRREAGSYGRDTRGILRVHQFDKIEAESFTLPENSINEQDFLVAIQEYLLQSLELPYQVVAVCTGDMGGPDARQIDIETWMPGQNRYRETHSADLVTDYQARRLNTRVRRGDQLEFVHMNDATVFAIGRTIIAIMENYQTKEGTIKIPKVLRKYMSGVKEMKN